MKNVDFLLNSTSSIFDISPYLTISVSENFPCPSKTLGAYILYFLESSLKPY